MSLHRTDPNSPHCFRRSLRGFLRDPGLAFADILSTDEVDQIARKHGANFGADDRTIYTPAITLWAFLSQMLFTGAMRSCRAAVKRVSVYLDCTDGRSCCEDTGDYCRARARLALRLLRDLTLRVSGQAEDQIPSQWLWHGLHPKVVDGAVCNAADTIATQKKFPQTKAQKPGLGQPLVRITGLISLITGMVVDLRTGPCQGKQTGEPSMFSRMLSGLKSTDLIVADRYYCSFALLALLMEQGIHGVFRLHHGRKPDFRKGRRLSKDDHVVTWHRGKRCPVWMTKEDFHELPNKIDVREVRVHVDRPGFRTREFVIVTTLLDADEFTIAELAGLYRRRWEAELHLRSIKRSMGLAELRCKSPAMIRREIWVGILAYNLIRRTMLQAANEQGVVPHQLSFTAALQATAASWMVLAVAGDMLADRLARLAVAHLGDDQVADRPDRVEPRKVKRRHNRFPILTELRDIARARLLTA